MSVVNGGEKYANIYHPEPIQKDQLETTVLILGIYPQAKAKLGAISKTESEIRKCVNVTNVKFKHEDPETLDVGCQWG